MVPARPGGAFPALPRLISPPLACTTARRAAQDDRVAYANRMRRTALEVLDDFPSVVIPLAYVADVFPPLQPRAFSISSSPRVAEAAIALVARRVGQR